MRNQTTGGFLVSACFVAIPQTRDRCSCMNYLLVNRPEITQNELIMKRYSLLVAIIITAVICASSFAQDKASLQPNATVA